MADETDVQSVEARGVTIPKLGLGTWQNTGRQCAETVETALELGYRHVDTAQVYGNEEMVGEGIAAADVDREDVFLTTKVWRSNLRHDDVVESVEASLDRLGVAYVDLLLIHWPHPRVPIAGTLSAMADLRADGLVSHVGVANFTRSQLREATAASKGSAIATGRRPHRSHSGGWSSRTASSPSRKPRVGPTSRRTSTSSTSRSPTERWTGSTTRSRDWGDASATSRPR